MTTNTQDLTTATYVARYNPSTASHYFVRGIISTIIWTVIGIAVTLFIAQINPDSLWQTIVSAVIFLFPVLISLSAAFKAKNRYNTDDHLAIAVTPTGLALPGRGTITWDHIVGVRKSGTGLATGSVFLFAFEALIGTRETNSISVHVNGGVEELDKLANAPGVNPAVVASLGVGATRNDPSKGYRIPTAFIQGLGQDTYNKTLAAVIDAASKQGVPTNW